MKCAHKWISRGISVAFFIVGLQIVVILFLLFGPTGPLQPDDRTKGHRALPRGAADAHTPSATGGGLLRALAFTGASGGDAGGGGGAGGSRDEAASDKPPPPQRGVDRDRQADREAFRRRQADLAQLRKDTEAMEAKARTKGAELAMEAKERVRSDTEKRLQRRAERTAAAQPKKVPQLHTKDTSKGATNEAASGSRP